MRYGSAEARPRRSVGSRVVPGILLALVGLAACVDAAPAPPRADPGEGGEGPQDALSIEERRAIAGFIVFVSERRGRPEVLLIRPDGEDERRLLHDAGPAYPAAVSPDGSTVLVVSVEETEEDGRAMHYERLLAVPIAGGAVRPLAPRAGRARNPSWSPDGAWIVFESDLSSFSDLHRVRTGSALERLTLNEEGNFEPAVSPDGRHIAFVSSRDGNAEIYRMDVDGGEHTRLTAFHLDDTGPRWSPDGRTIAFLSDREGASRIFLMAADGTGQRRLTRDSLSSRMHEEHPVWSPDGKRIAYVIRDPEGGSTISIADLQTGALRRIPGDGSMPDWSPDGRHIAFVSTVTGDPQIHLARADGSRRTPVTRAPGPNWLPRWIPPSP
jgi:TolB protein